MKLKIPTKIKFKLEKKYISLIAGIMIFTIIFIGSAYVIRSFIERRTIEEKQRECLLFTDYINQEVIPLTQSNVTDCVCSYSPIKVSDEITGNCICSCKLYDANGTLIDEDWNPLFSIV